jgi:hypothetical protein
MNKITLEKITRLVATICASIAFLTVAACTVAAGAKFIIWLF